MRTQLVTASTFSDDGTVINVTKTRIFENIKLSNAPQSQSLYQSQTTNTKFYTNSEGVNQSICKIVKHAPVEIFLITH